MGIYWTVLMCSMLFWWLIKLFGKKEQFIMETQEIDNKQMIAYFILMATFMIALIGLRSEFIGIDTLGYFSRYHQLSEESFSLINNTEDVEKGYVFLQILCNKLKIHFYFFNFLNALFNIFVISYLIYKKSALPWLSYILYICFGFFILDFTMMRQNLAISIVILAILLSQNKGIKGFIVFVVLIFAAMQIHASAIICLPLWFFTKISFNKKTVGVLILLIILSYIFKESLSRLILEFSTEVRDKYENYGKDMGSGTYGLRLYLMMLVTVIFSLFFNKHLINNPFNQFMFYCMCIMLILYPSVQNIGGAVMRIYFYFYIFMIVYIPNMLSGLDKKKDFLPYCLIIALYVVVGVMQYWSQLETDWYLIVPYKFFWQI